MIEQLSVQYGVKESCAALRVSRSAFYRWKSGQEGKRAREQKELIQQIDEIFKAHNQRYGSPRVTRVLRQNQKKEPLFPKKKLQLPSEQKVERRSSEQTE